MTKRNRTRIVVCEKCSMRTRHEWRRWERKTLLLKVTGHAELVEGWVCTKCGHKSHIRRIGLVKVSAST